MNVSDMIFCSNIAAIYSECQFSILTFFYTHHRDFASAILDLLYQYINVSSYWLLSIKNIYAINRHQDVAIFYSLIGSRQRFCLIKRALFRQQMNIGDVRHIRGLFNG